MRLGTLTVGSSLIRIFENCLCLIGKSHGLPFSHLMPDSVPVSQLMHYRCKAAST
jgi:hypothetical protein